MKLPFHSRINWRILARNNKRALVLCISTVVMALLVLAGLAFALSSVETADYRMRLGQLQHDVISVRTFGQLTGTDMREGTATLETRRLK